MSKDRKAQALTAALLLVALGAALARKLGPKADPTPQDAIYAMLNAARAGDVKAYLNSYTGPMEASLRKAAADATEPAFAKYLRDTNSSLKGIAVSDPQNIGDREVAAPVEFIYQDRNEAQMMYLEKGPGGWKISRADSDERVKTLIPYGTPVK